jgi:hypothetical protein
MDAFKLILVSLAGWMNCQQQVWSAEIEGLEPSPGTQIAAFSGSAEFFDHTP